jgi:hypothetical protein
MAAIERELYHWGHRLQAIPRALKTLDWSPDVVVLDTPPSLGPYAEAAMCFVDLWVAPVPTGAFALQGLAEVESAWQQVREHEGHRRGRGSLRRTAGLSGSPTARRPGTGRRTRSPGFGSGARYRCSHQGAVSVHAVGNEIRCRVREPERTARC